MKRTHACVFITQNAFPNVKERIGSASMPRYGRTKNRAPEVIAKFAVGGLFLLALAIGGRNGIPGILSALLGLIWLFCAAGLVALVVWVVLKRNRAKNSGETKPADTVPPATEEWTESRIVEKLHAIDWYQFEKFNAAILAKEGWSVERKGGATPDGGVDLIATNGEKKVLIQCKHWKTWRVQEKVIREMLGSMTHFGVTSGAIHTLKGWTKPAAAFAATHRIALRDEQNLAALARSNLTDAELNEWLLSPAHHCPKCEAVMIWRTGDFKPFWGCSTYPRCRGVLREA